MPAQIVLVRAVNVGGTGKLVMADLRAWLTQLGFADVRTLLNSGNVLLRGGARRGRELELYLEHQIQKKFGATVEFFVRSSAEWKEVVRRNPFPAEARSDPSRLVVVALRSAPAAPQVKALQAAIKGRELVRAHGRELYAVYPDGQGASKLTLPVIEKHLGTRGTARNWNTVLKLAALAAT